MSSKTSCGTLYLRWIRAEQKAHVTLQRGQRRRHLHYERVSVNLFKKAARSGCRWAK